MSTPSQIDESLSHSHTHIHRPRGGRGSEQQMGESKIIGGEKMRGVREGDEGARRSDGK